MRKTETAVQRCKTMSTLQKILGGKWKLEILYYIAFCDIRRFGALRRQLGEITESSLTKQLRELEADGFLLRHDFHEVPPRVEYTLSDLGASFMDVLSYMKKWGERNLSKEETDMLHYDTVIFDLDGTLLDTLEDLKNAVNHALGEMNFPARSLEEVRQFVGNGVAKLMERAVPAGTGPRETARALDIFKAYYEQHKMDTTAPYPGVMEMLKALKEKGCKLAVVSNKFDGAVKGLVSDYFPGLMDAAAGENEAGGVPKKPDPAMVLRVMEELKAEKAVYIGDSDVDIQTAQNSGLPCISVTWGFRDKDFLTRHGAAAFVDAPTELVSLICE